MNISPHEKNSILTAIDDNEHSRHRRSLASAFSEKALREQEPLIKKYIDLFITRLHENTGRGAQDMVSWYNFVTFDIIGDLTMGDSFDCLQQSDYHPFVSYHYEYFKTSAFLTAARQFWQLTPILLRFIPKDLQKSRMSHAVFAKEKIEKRIAMGTERHDFMSNVLRHNGKEVNNISSSEVYP